MIELLTNLFYRLRLPNDNEIKNSLTLMNFYEGSKQYSKFVLGKIEEHNTKVSVDFRNPKITIEHIMPCLLYTSDAADERSSVDLGGRRIIKKKKINEPYTESIK